MYHQVFIRRINESTNVQQLTAEYHAVQGIIDRQTYSNDADYQDLLAKLEIISSRIQVLQDENEPRADVYGNERNRANGVGYGMRHREAHEDRREDGPHHGIR